MYAECHMTNSATYHGKDSTSIIISRLKEIASAVMYAAEAGKLEQVLERIAQISRELVSAKYAALGIPDGRGGLRYFKTAGLTKEQLARFDHLPTGRGLIGAIMRERQSIRLENMQADSRSAGFCGPHPVMTSLLGVPIQIGQQLFGTLYLCDREDGQPFTDEDQELIETMAGYAAVAIASSQINDRQSRLATLEERERIGMELHDGIIQSLYAIGMHLDLMRMNQIVSADELGEAIHNLNTVIEDIRRYIMKLHRGDRPARTVADSMREMLDRLHTPDSLSIELEAPDEPPPFTPAVFEAVCQMANEAISNAVRHADARRIRIVVEQQGLQFTVQIADDGKGFDLFELTHNSGLGLRNLQQRAALNGGTVHIDTQPGQGTRVTISLPTRLV